jgi:SAM-dependent methyltransferase
MRRDWDERARKNARHYVATSRENWGDEEFFESGKIWVNDYVLPELPLICRSKPASEVRVLEIGCGAGRMTKALSQLFGEVDAVDISPEMAAVAESALHGVPNARIYVNDGTSLSMFDDAVFDFVFSAIVFQHVPRKAIVVNYIREAARVLRPGGVFKFQVEGCGTAEDYAGTWEGAGFTEMEMRSIAVQCGFTVHSAVGSGTQYFWLVFVRPEIQVRTSQDLET